MHAMQAYVGQTCHARICLHAYLMQAYVDVDMQMHMLMHVNAYACICMLGMHIPLAGGAHPGGLPAFEKGL